MDCHRFQSAHSKQQKEEKEDVKGKKKMPKGCKGHEDGRKMEVLEGRIKITRQQLRRQRRTKAAKVEEEMRRRRRSGGGGGGGGGERGRKEERKRRTVGNGRARCSRIGAPVCTMCAESPCWISPLPFHVSYTYTRVGNAIPVAISSWTVGARNRPPPWGLAIRFMVVQWRPLIPKAHKR